MSITDKVRLIIRRRPFLPVLTLCLLAPLKLQAQLIFKDGFEGDPPSRTLFVIANEGGFILSGSGLNNCREGENCLIDVTTGVEFSDIFTAVPRAGYVFPGWQEGEQFVCGGSTQPCDLLNPQSELADKEGDARLEALFEPEGSIVSPDRGSLWVCSYTVPVDSVHYVCEVKDFELYGYGKLEDYRVTSGILFVDIEARKVMLNGLSPEKRHEWCRTDKMSHIDIATYTGIPPVDSSQVPPESDIFELLIWGRIHYHYFDDNEAGRMILRNLLAWADAEVDLNVDFLENHQAIYQLGLIAPIYLTAWDAIRGAPFVSVEDREKVDDYLYRLVVELAEYETQRLGQNDGFVYVDILNHGWSQDLPVMVYGVMKGNDSLFQRVVARYFSILDGLVRPDGSHHFESQRGGSALQYSTYATAFLVRMAELAANQSYNLYDVDVDGVSLHTIMAFHISALEDPELMHQYTQFQNPDACNEVQCANWDRQICSEEYLSFCYEGAWPTFEIYRKRFPSSPLVGRYLALFPDVDFQNLAEGPFMQTCEFRKVEK